MPPASRTAAADDTPPPAIGSGTASFLATGMASSSDVQAVSLKRERSLLAFVSGAISSKAQLFPRMSSTTAVSQACGGSPSMASSTLDFNGTRLACACRFHCLKDSGAPATSTAGIPATWLLSSSDSQMTRKSSGANE
jgi:hypothetical protein